MTITDCLAVTPTEPLRIGQWVVGPNARSYLIINIAGPLAILQARNRADCATFKLQDLKVYPFH